MKRIKISMMAVVAIVLGVAASAFTVPKANFTDAWFTIQNPSAPNVASSYAYYGTTSPCSSNDHLCAIKGTRDVSPNQNLPLQSSVDAAKTASNNFTHTVANEVTFAAP